jgi:hypothetical protein
MESEQKYKITIKPFSDGKLIQSYKSNPEFGYVILESDELYFDESIHGLEFLKTNGDKSKLPKRQAILRGRFETLKKFVEICYCKELPGRIRVQEYLENEVPENVRAQFIRDDIAYEEAISPYLKKFHYKTHFRLKKNDASIVLKSQGQRILHFMEWSMDVKEDIFIIKYDNDINQKFKGLLEDALTPPKFTTIEELEKEEIFGNKREKKEAPATKKENVFSDIKFQKDNRERSLESIKRENAVMLPLVAVLVLGAIVALIMLPSLFTAVSVIVGLLIIFYFAGAFYEAIFTKPVEFDLLRTILIGVVVILVIGAILIINELTPTTHDPDMWRHP